MNTVMFHIGRSGSTVVADLLNDHPQIGWGGELLKGTSATSTHKPAKNANPDDRWYNSPFFPSEPWRFIESQALSCGKNLYGFEVKFFHLAQNNLSLSDFYRATSQMGFSRFIILKRQNYLRKVVSSLVGKQLSQYHILASDKAPLIKIVLDTEAVGIDGDIKPLLTRLHGWNESFKELDDVLEGRPVLRLSYEDDIMDNPLTAYRKVCAFLNLPAYQPAIRYGRTNPFSLRDLLLNFEDVARALGGTEFEWMLNA